MRYQLLGRSGLRVSELCLGTMTFGADKWGSDESDAAAIYSRYRDAGGNFFDTANEIYAEGRSEEFLGRLVAGHRDEVVLATKYSLAMPGGRDANRGGNHRKSLMRSLEASLKRLGTDHVDLLWIHAWDGVTPVDELLRSLDDVVRQGKVQYLGASNLPAWVVAQCNTLADCKGWTPFAGLQCEYSLIERSVEHELLPMARRLDLAMLAWSPLASGILSGKYDLPASGQAKRLDSMAFHQLDERKLRIAAVVGEVARATGRSAPQVALAWLRARRGVIPIIGARTLAQLEDNLACTSFSLGAEALATLESASAIAPIYPYDYLAKVQAVIHAGFQDRLDSHSR